MWILMKQVKLEWQWQQLDHMQIICTLLHTGNHASTSSVIFYRPGALPDAQPTVSKHWRHMSAIKMELEIVLAKHVKILLCVFKNKLVWMCASGSLMMREVCSWNDVSRSDSGQTASAAHSVLSSHSVQAPVSVRIGVWSASAANTCYFISGIWK